MRIKLDRVNNISALYDLSLTARVSNWFPGTDNYRGPRWITRFEGSVIGWIDDPEDIAIHNCCNIQSVSRYGDSALVMLNNDHIYWVSRKWSSNYRKQWPLVRIIFPEPQPSIIKIAADYQAAYFVSDDGRCWLINNLDQCPRHLTKPTITPVFAEYFVHDIILAYPNKILVYDDLEYGLIYWPYSVRSIRVKKIRGVDSEHIIDGIMERCLVNIKGHVHGVNDDLSTQPLSYFDNNPLLVRRQPLLASAHTVS